ncbi:GIY-YIG nuclease family protein [Ekhidna sp.]|uniref:GIY-YIG nuclease family protein n=1 Tax=Ekhidna sp. TaxID=2608089 RepID=UPI0032EBCCFC
MHHFVYALYSPKFNKIYIGRTSNIKARLMSHFYTGTRGFTVKYRPWRLAYLEKCRNKNEASRREKQLKSAKGRQFVWEKIQIKFH